MDVVSLIAYIDQHIDFYHLTETQRLTYKWLCKNKDLIAPTDCMEQLQTFLQEMAYAEKIKIIDKRKHDETIMATEYVSIVTPSRILRRKCIP